jgi:hypothetical protein
VVFLKLWILFSDTYYKNIEGVYTTEGKAKKEEQLFSEALQRRESVNNSYASEIIELKELRQPYITEAEMLLDNEKAAKAADDVVLLKHIRKQRKVLLRQADQITYDIKRREDKILASQRMTRSEILSAYGRDCYWEDHYVEE